MRVHQHPIEFATRGRALVDVTAEIAHVVADSGIATGVCHVFVQHTSASLVIQENADPAVLRDMQTWLAKMAPEGAGYEHDAEGPDDMPAHLRASMTRTSETIPVLTGALGLGTWQAVYLWEHRARSHRRTLVVTVMGV